MITTKMRKGRHPGRILIGFAPWESNLAQISSRAKEITTKRKQLPSCCSILITKKPQLITPGELILT